MDAANNTVKDAEYKTSYSLVYYTGEVLIQGPTGTYLYINAI